jgi:enoyl-CoA hydratase/carnithine racemase
MPLEILEYETFGPVARLTLHRPKAMNALNAELVRALDAALDRIETDDAIRVVIVTGSENAFCAGADLKDALAPAKRGEADFLTLAGSMMNRFRTIPKPVIAALNGVTMAGGLELAMSADIVVASNTAKIADAHANFGVFPGAGGASVLPRLVPLQSALHLLFTGKSVSAQRMYDLGLVNELYPADQLAEMALKLANAIAAKSPAVLRRMKLVARQVRNLSQDEALALEQAQFREHLLSEDLQEGLQAFAEKRAPNFTGR